MTKKYLARKSKRKACSCSLFKEKLTKNPVARKEKTINEDDKFRKKANKGHSR